MQNVTALARVALASLCLVELASALSRLRHREARREAAWLGLLLAAFACRLTVPRGTIADVAIPIAVVAFTVDLLLAIHRRPGAVAWTTTAMASAAVLAGLELAGFAGGTVRWIGVGLICLLSVPAIVLLVVLLNKTGEPADVALLVSSAIWGAASCAEAAGLIPLGASDWLVAPLLVLIGFMLFEQGYLSPLTSSGYVDRLAAERRLLRRTYARMLESRNALVLQDRLIAAGLLALGAAHEFKDVLAAVRVTAEHGRALREPGQKDRCLELVAEHAAAGGSEAAEFLERLGREGREEPSRLEVRQLVERLIRIARPSWRPAGITILTDIPDLLAVQARGREIEQVLMNLIRNAVEAIEASGICPREIHVRAKGGGGCVQIAVCDQAGGVPAAVRDRLFTIGNSGTGSTGIGLYLARDLASRNGGSLAYSTGAHGSCFVLSLPVPN